MASYSEQQIEDFVSLAADIGIAATIKELNYPKSRNTAHYWCKQRGVSPTVDDLRSKAAQMKHFYGEQEQLAVLNSLLDRIQQALEDARLTPDELTKLARAAQSTVETMRLVGGQSTQTVQTIDSVDAEIKTLIKQLESLDA